MRALIEEQLSGRELPLIMAHGGGSAHDKENSIAAIHKSLKLGADIIEVDIRKSRDGILYCHHGSEPWGIIAATFFHHLTFTQIKRLVGDRDTLEQTLMAIPETILVYLDLKDPSIAARDLSPILKGRKNMWIAPFGKIAWLKELRRNLGEGYAYAFNRPALFARHVAKQLNGQADMIQFCVWDWNQKTLSLIEGGGVMCHMVEWFINREEYIKSMQLSRWKGFFFSVYDVTDASKIKRII